MAVYRRSRSQVEEKPQHKGPIYQTVTKRKKRKTIGLWKNVQN